MASSCLGGVGGGGVAARPGQIPWQPGAAACPNLSGTTCSWRMSYSGFISIMITILIGIFVFVIMIIFTEALASPPVAASGYGAVGAVAVAVTQPHLLQRPQLVQQPPQMPQQVPQQMPQQQVQAVPQLQSFPSPGISNPGMPTGMTMPVPVAMPMGMPIGPAPSSVLKFLSFSASQALAVCLGEPPLKRPRSAGELATCIASSAQHLSLQAPSAPSAPVQPCLSLCALLNSR